jgi:hypothetical protein
LILFFFSKENSVSEWNLKPNDRLLLYFLTFFFSLYIFLYFCMFIPDGAENLLKEDNKILDNDMNV